MNRARQASAGEVLDPAVQGHFARKHLGSHSRIIAWGHRLRSRIDRCFVIREVRVSPFGGFAGCVSSQVWSAANDCRDCNAA
jgi:hypothetical protein